jgi:UDP-galactose transporter B1
MRLIECVAGIVVFNLAWGYFQERVGAREYCSDGGGVDGAAAAPVCERFASIPLMNLLQAVLATLVPALILQLRGALGSPSLTPFAHFVEPSLCHTIASPVGYAAMRFIPYPLYVLVSSCKLVPVLVVGLIVNRRWPRPVDYASATIMTGGIILYSIKQIASASASHAGHGHHHPKGADSQSPSLFGVELDPAQTLVVGILCTLLNLSLEGYTNAAQDRIAIRAAASRGTSAAAGAGSAPATATAAKPAASSGWDASLWMQVCMNAWSVVFLGLGLGAEALVRGDSSFLLSGAAFAARHPEVLAHISSFAILGAIAQVFIFACIEAFGSFTTTTVTISRKFVTVLVSVFAFGHELALAQWAGVLLVFSGLFLQLAYGRSHHHHAAGGEKAKEEKTKKEQ